MRRKHHRAAIILKNVPLIRCVLWTEVSHSWAAQGRAKLVAWASGGKSVARRCVFMRIEGSSNIDAWYLKNLKDLHRLVNIQKTMGNHHFHGTTHYFNGHFLKLPEANKNAAEMGIQGVQPQPSKFTAWQRCKSVEYTLLIYHIDLVGGFKHDFDVPFHIWDVILPIDELIFFKMVRTC